MCATCLYRDKRSTGRAISSWEHAEPTPVRGVVVFVPFFVFGFSLLTISPSNRLLYLAFILGWVMVLIKFLRKMRI